MRILDLTQFSRFRDQRDVKVLRHKDTVKDLWAMRAAREPFERYQNGQSWDVFGTAKFILSFIAERDKYCKFVGVWEVLEKQQRGTGWSYATRELEGFEDLSERLVVYWGTGTRSWAQWLHRAGNKTVSEILPTGYVADFPGYYDLVLRYDQIVRMIKQREANREWRRMLTSVSGVYLILDTTDGQQYVGSATGRGGIWGRWQQYAKSPSGGNLLLRRLLEDDPARCEHFQFSILRVLEPGIPKEAVLEHERIAKQKLGSRAFGLNAN